MIKQEKTKDLEKQLEEFRKQVEGENKFPKMGGTYWVVSAEGIVMFTKWDNDEMDNDRLSIEAVGEDRVKKYYLEVK